jgi:hypothetical protein
MGRIASATCSFAIYPLDHWTIASSSSLHYATPTRHTRHSRHSRLSCDFHALQAPQARIFPRLTHHSHAILASSVIYCHHEFASLHCLEVSLSLGYHVRDFHALRAPIAPYSRAYRLVHAPYMHHYSHPHSQASLRQLSPPHPRAFTMFAFIRVTLCYPLCHDTFTPLCRLTHALSRA